MQLLAFRLHATVRAYVRELLYPILSPSSHLLSVTRSEVRGVAYAKALLLAWVGGFVREFLFL